MSKSKRPDMTIRRAAQDGELPLCFEIYAKAIQGYVPPSANWDRDGERAAFLDIVTENNTGMHVRNGNVIGFDSFFERPRDIWLNGIYFHAEYDAALETEILGYILNVAALARLTGKKMRTRILKTLPQVAVYRKWGFQVLDEDDNYLWLEGNGTFGH